MKINWFKRLSIANKLAFMALIIATVTLVVTLFPFNTIGENAPDDNQQTQGDNSPIINTNGDVNVKY